MLGDFVILARRSEKERGGRRGESVETPRDAKARRISRCSKNLRAFVRVQPRAMLGCIRDASIMLSRIDKSTVVRYDVEKCGMYQTLQIRSFVN